MELGFEFPALGEELLVNRLEKVNRALSKIEGAKEVKILSSEAIKTPTHKRLKYGSMRRYRISDPIKTSIEAEFVGTVTDEGGVMNYSSVDGTNLTEITTHRCDSCGRKHHRSKVFCFRENGNLKVLGSSCAIPYFGVDFGKVFSMLEGMFEASEEEFSSIRSQHEDLILIAEGVAKAFANNATYIKGETPAIVRNLINGGNEFHLPLEPKLKGSQVVDKLTSYVKNELDKEANFGASIHSALFDQEGEVRELISKKSLGLLVWAAYQALGTKDELKFIGEVGEKVEVKGTVVETESYQNGYGSYVTDLIVKTEEGEKVEVSSGANWVSCQKVGDSVTFTANVKFHHRKTNRTIVSTPKFISTSNEAYNKGLAEEAEELAKEKALKALIRKKLKGLELEEGEWEDEEGGKIVVRSSTFTYDQLSFKATKSPYAERGAVYSYHNGRYLRHSFFKMGTDLKKAVAAAKTAIVKEAIISIKELERYA